MNDVLVVLGLPIYIGHYIELLKKIDKEKDVVVAPLTMWTLIGTVLTFGRFRSHRLVDYFYPDSRVVRWMISRLFKKLPSEYSTDLLLEILGYYQGRRVLLLGVAQKKIDDFMFNIRRVHPDYNFMGVINERVSKDMERQSLKLIDKIRPEVTIMKNREYKKYAYLSFFKLEKDYRGVYFLLGRAIDIYSTRNRKKDIRKRLLSNFFKFFYRLAFYFLIFPLYLMVLITFAVGILCRRLKYGVV